MACYSRWEQTLPGGAKRLQACGQCIGCRLEYCRQWAIRCMHEASMHDTSSYVTLTYNEENLPIGKNLIYRDFQLFLKRTRKHFAPTPIRFYMSGEYGERDQRPHFHALLFGAWFPDRQRFTKQGDNWLYTSATLDKLWGKGFTSVGDVTQQSANYVARYVMKKLTGPAAAAYDLYDTDTGEYLGKRRAEFSQMSRDPGIGNLWIKKYINDVYPDGTVIVNGHETRSPRYYDQHHKKVRPKEHIQLQMKRAKETTEQLGETHNPRLEARETVKRAQIAQLKRKL